MYNELNSYLFQHKSISLPGLGTIFLEMQPSRLDSSGKYINPPTYRFRFDKYFDAPDKDFFSHLAAEKNIPDYEAIKWYNEFSYDLRNKIRQDGNAAWEGVGILKKDSEGNIVFESTASTPDFLVAAPLPEDIVSPMEETLANPLDPVTEHPQEEVAYPFEEAAKKNNWWLFAAIAAAIAVLVLLFHFSSNGWEVQSIGNQQHLETAK